MKTNIEPIANSSIPSNIDFPFFERAIEILVVDDEPSILELHSEYLNQFKLYNVTLASSAKEANDILESKKRIHVCIFDLGLQDLHNDEYSRVSG